MRAIRLEMGFVSGTLNRQSLPLSMRFFPPEMTGNSAGLLESRFKQARPRTLFRQSIPRIPQRASFRRQASAPDASLKFVAKPRKPLDPPVQFILPTRRKPLPIVRVGCSLVWKSLQRLPNRFQLHSSPLRHAYDRYSPQHLAREPSLIPIRSPASNKSRSLIEMQR